MLKNNMNLNKTPALCLDADESLINSQFISSPSSKTFMEETYGEIWPYIHIQFDWDEQYISFLRPWARELVEFSKNLVGEENVFILSTGIIDYVKEVNSRHNLGVLDQNIYGREDIKATEKAHDFAHPAFIGKNCILIDNENYEYHTDGRNNKVSFLDNLPKNKFIEVPDFDVRYFNPKDDDGYLDILKDLIVRTLAI